MTMPGERPPERLLHAQENDSVYQAAGAQFIFHGPPPASGVVVTNSLPRESAGFTGRSDELHAIENAVDKAARNGDIIPVHAIDGMPGVGKTALAIHVGHRLRDRFPDRQLYVNLHAHSANRSPVDPADALYWLLAEDGATPAGIPPGLDARVALWRARLDGKRVLLIIDNAAGQAQVEPLLAGTADSFVLVTSRRRLTGLGARHAAITMSLPTMPPDEAAALFIQVLGQDRDAPETQAIAEVTRLCGYLPLAISLLAAKLRPERQWTVARLVEDLGDARERLAHLHTEDVDVAATFELSYRDLPAVRQRLFRRLGLHPGADIDAYAAAALDDTSVASARTNLEALYEHHLLDQPVRGRYQIHDLLGEYARSLAEHDNPADRTRTTDRLLDYYNCAAVSADRHLAQRPQSTPAIPHTVPCLADPKQAKVWLNADKENLFACVAYAERTGQPARVVQFAAALAAFLNHEGSTHRAIALHESAATAARRLGDERGLAYAWLNLGLFQRRQGKYPDALTLCDAALRLYRKLDDLHGQADTLNEIGTVHRLNNAFPIATEEFREALRLYVETRDEAGEAAVLANMAVVEWVTDQFAEATAHLDQALEIQQRRSDRLGQAHALLGLGVVRRLTSAYPAAVEALEEALAGYQEAGHRLGEANALHNLAIVERLTERYEAAAEYLRRSLDLYREVSDRLGQANGYKQLGIVERLLGNDSAAAAALEEALAIYEQIADRLGQAGVLLDLGRLTGDVTALREAQRLYRALGNRLGQVEAGNHAGELLLGRAEPRPAVRAYRQALRLAREVGCPSEVGRALCGLGRSLVRLGEADSGLRYLGQAHRVFAEIGNHTEAARVATEIEALAK